MLFLSKFIASWLLPPGIFILILVYFAYRWRRNSVSKLLLFFAGLLCILSVPALSGRMMHALEYRYIPTVTKVDAVIVLGGGFTKGAPDIFGMGSLSGGSSQRFMAGFQLQEQLGVPVIYTGYPEEEANLFEQWAMKYCTSDVKIILEKQAKNTKQHPFYLLPIMKKENFKRVAVVTNAYHMERSMVNFRRSFEPNGIEVIPYPCGYYTDPEFTMEWFEYFPCLHGFALSWVFFHECLGILAIYIFG